VKLNENERRKCMKAYYEICPCKGCTYREVACHGKCKKYQAWKNSGIEIKEPFVEYPKKRRRAR
jgi:hypothetical protein